MVSAVKQTFGAAEQEIEPEYQHLAESIPNLAWVAHADGSIHWYNRRWYEYTGTTPEQMRGWGWTVVHDPAQLPRVMARWRESIRTGKPFEMTFPLRGADGAFRPFLTRVVPSVDAQGAVLRWFGTNTDVGVELRAMAALQESEQRFRTATQAVDGVLWTNTAQGEMQGEQPGWSGFTGQSFEQYSGHGWSRAVHPEDAQPTVDAWMEAVREKRLFAFEHRVRRHDGVYRLCSIRALPILHPDGRVQEWVGVHRDVTEDRERQQALRASLVALRRQEELVEVAQIANNVGFWRYQPDGGELFLSSGSRQLLGLLKTGEVSADEVFTRVHPEDLPVMMKALADALETGVYNVEFRVPTGPPEEFRWLLGVARLVRAEDGAPYLVGMNLDITQQKRSSEALIRTEKLAVAGRLAASIAHEINNPLEAVTNLLYLLMQTPLNEEQGSHCETMMSELRRVAEIATHTLRFHRQATQPGETRVDDLMESVLVLFESRIRNAGIAVQRGFADTCALVAFNGELRQVFANVAGNAIDAIAATTGGERTLWLRTREGRDWQSGTRGVVVSIADTGSGIPPSVMSRIFDPFFTTKGEVGTGLGLWVSTEIVRKHHGRIQVRSSQRAASRGTVFRIFLPLQTVCNGHALERIQA